MIECVNGGDLMFHMQRHRRLPEEHARFYSAEISLALSFLHERGTVIILHLHPECLLNWSHYGQFILALSSKAVVLFILFSL